MEAGGPEGERERRYSLARQLSREPSLDTVCLICLDPITGGAGDWRLGCECIIHFHCFTSYLASRLDDRLTMALDGVACPYGEGCQSHENGTPYFITLQDLDSVADAGATVALSRVLADNQVEALTHEQVQNLRDWIGEELHLRRRGDSRIDDPFVLATTKACPSCGFRSTHAHGHACHHISPAKAPKRGGCPNWYARRINIHFIAPNP